MLRNINKIIYSNAPKLKCFLVPISYTNKHFSVVDCFISGTIDYNNRPTFNQQNKRSITTCIHCSHNSQFTRDHLQSFNNTRPRMYSTILSVYSPNIIPKVQKRFKTKKTQKRPEYDSDSDDEEKHDYEEISKATKPITMYLQSLRVDGILKKALNVSRNKVETAFYEGNIRVNGTKPGKKSYQVKIGDEVDLIKGISPINPEFLSISRVEIISVVEDSGEEEGQLLVKMRRTKTMYIENYESNPWKKTSTAE